MSEHNPNAVAFPVPRSAAEFLALRKNKSQRTNNDLVEEIHLRLADDKAYTEYLDAVGDDEAIEGSLAADNFKASEMIREFARKNDPDGKVAHMKLATINKALAVVLRRYGLGRKERRYTIQGEVVPAEPNGE